MASVDIYIKEAEGSREIRIPWLPDKVYFDSNGSRMSSYEIMDVGEVNVPSGSNLSGFNWSSYFPGQGHKNIPFLRGTWQDPKKIHTILEEWREKGTPLRIIMTCTPINHDVYINDYSAVFESGYGDYNYDLSFKKRRKIKISSQRVAAMNSGLLQSNTGGSGSGGRTYTVKSGDTLWAIAQKYYGSGAKYGTIYNANKAAIEETAKKRGMSSSSGGHWIFPGQTLVIP